MNTENKKRGNGMKLSRSLISILCVYIIPAFAFPENLCAGKFIQRHIHATGVGEFISGDEATLAKYHVIVMGKKNYDDIIGGTCSRIKTLNPKAEIYLYTQVTMCHNDDDSRNIINSNNMARYNLSRGHSMGSLNINNPGFFLLDNANERVYNKAYSQPPEIYNYLMEFGNAEFQSYSIEATKTDHLNQPWMTNVDGIYSDICFSIRVGNYNSPAKYNTDALWSAAMNSMVEAVTSALHDDSVKFACNRGKSKTESGYNAWLSLDSSPNPPDAVLEEGAFAVEWGTGYETQFFGESDWKRQIDILRLLKNSKILYISHTELSPGEIGTDNYGNQVTYWQTFWYALGSYLLGKNDNLNNGYFMFGTHPYNTIPWFDEYDKIDLGKAVAEYNTTNYSGTNIYWREFEKGYVYVNPTKYAVSAISLPKTCKELTHDNFKNDPNTIPSINAINLKGNHSAILLKNTNDDITFVSPPSDFRIEQVD